MKMDLKRVRNIKIKVPFSTWASNDWKKQLDKKITMIWRKNLAKK